MQETEVKMINNCQGVCGTKRGAAIAANSSKNLIKRGDNPKCSVLISWNFIIATILLDRETTQNYVILNRPKL